MIETDGVEEAEEDKDNEDKADHNALPIFIKRISDLPEMAKETIEEELKSESAHYMPFWEIIDDIRNNKFHNTLHAAGYFLSPSLFYSTDFHADAEITIGLLCYIPRMAQEEKDHDLVSRQVVAYREAKGSFGDGHASDQWSNISFSL